MQVRGRVLEVVERAVGAWESIGGNGRVVGIRRAVVRRRKAIAVAVLALIAAGPLLRGAGLEGLAANVAGIGIAALVVRRISKDGRRQRGRGR